jgi:hypothetical protein
MISKPLNSHYEALVKLYMLTDKLEDLTSSNMIIMDGLLEYGDRVGKMLRVVLIRQIFDSSSISIPVMLIKSIPSHAFSFAQKTTLPRQIHHNQMQRHQYPRLPPPKRQNPHVNSSQSEEGVQEPRTRCEGRAR